MKTIIFILVIISIFCLPIFSQEETVLFDASIGFSYYVFSDFQGVSLVADNFNYNLQLIMGLKLFGKISTYFDLGIDDPTFKRSINFAGTIGSKYFTVQLDYHRVRGNLEWIEFGFKQNLTSVYDNYKSEKNELFDQTWLTAALMLPRFSAEPGNFVDHLGGDVLFGFFWNHSIMPTDIILTYYDDDVYICKYFLDTRYLVNAWGIRMAILQDMMADYSQGILQLPLFNLENSNFFLYHNAIFDFGLGFGKSNYEIIDIGIMYMKIRDMIGLGYNWDIGSNGSINIIVGFDFSLEYFLPVDFPNHTLDIGNIYGLNTKNEGPFIRLGIKM
jgi:hypothetical protein